MGSEERGTKNEEKLKERKVFPQNNVKIGINDIFTRIVYIYYFTNVDISEMSWIPIRIGVVSLHCSFFFGNFN